MDRLVYLSLGKGRHVDEIRFSVLSAARYGTDGAPWETVVHTDDPESFADLPARTRPVTEDEAATWAGAADYVYSSKIAVLGDVLGAEDTERAAIIDGDTYFTESPARLFSRIGPGRSVMHLREGRPEPPEEAALRHVLGRADPVDSAGASWGLREREVLWNSGVVGLHRSDRELCGEASRLTDQLLENGFADHSHIAEMVGFGVVLDRRTVLRETRDLVTHYWWTEVRAPFDQVLRDTWSSDEPVDTAFRSLWDRRPRETATRRAKAMVKRTAARVGVDL